MRGALRWLRGDPFYRNRSWEDWCILAYYLGCIAVGAIAIGADDIYNLSGYGDIWSIGIATMGVAGSGAWLDHARRSEAVIICVIASLTVAHGGLMLLVGGDASIQTGMRLLIAPLMMVPFAVHRSRRYVSAEAVVRALDEGAGE